jgi:catechol 2,3-dioxygenase-like lactoylglutathione lyase family enzyme
VSDLRIDRVLETVVYCDAAQREATEAFYADTLRLRRAASWDTGCAFRLGPGVLLLFEREALADSDSPVSAHGTQGAGHVCFTAAGDYEAARAALADAGVEIEHDHEWPGGKRSFYFRDPAGNMLELAEGDIWPQ